METLGQYNKKQKLMGEIHAISNIDHTEHRCTCVEPPKRSWKYPWLHYCKVDDDDLCEWDTLEDAHLELEENCETLLGKEVCYKWDWVASSAKEMEIVKRLIDNTTYVTEESLAEDPHFQSIISKYQKKGVPLPPRLERNFLEDENIRIQEILKEYYEISVAPYVKGNRTILSPSYLKRLQVLLCRSFCKGECVNLPSSSSFSELTRSYIQTLINIVLCMSSFVVGWGTWLLYFPGGREYVKKMFTLNKKGALMALMLIVALIFAAQGSGLDVYTINIFQPIFSFLEVLSFPPKLYSTIATNFVDLIGQPDMGWLLDHFAFKLALMKGIQFILNKFLGTEEQQILREEIQEIEDINFGMGLSKDTPKLSLQRLKESPLSFGLSRNTKREALF